MGSGVSRLIRVPCLRPAGAGEERPPEFSGPLDEALGHSFCYVRSATPAHSRSSSASSSSAAAATAAETAFKSISGASVSANSSAPLPVYDAPAAATATATATAAAATRSQAAGFRSSASFSAIPLQLSGGGGGPASGPLDRGFFLSGPIERRALSGPLDAVPFSGPLVKKKSRGISRRLRKPSLFRRSLSGKNRRLWVVPLRNFAARRGEPGDASPPTATAGGNVQWAHGKAGEDRVHVVVSEEHRWLFVGIYDGFNGPEAPEFLVGNLYRSIFDELRGLFWEEAEEGAVSEEGADRKVTFQEDSKAGRRLWEFLAEGDGDGELDFSGSGRFAFSLSKLRDGFGSWRREGRRLWFPRWRYESEDKAKATREREVTERGGRRRRKAGPVADHELVLSALSRALEVTELAYLEMTDRGMDCNPELALMGSCLLVLLMRDDDVYVMNVGDSRAIVAQYRPPGTAEGTRDEGIANGQDTVVEGREMDVEIETLDREATELVALQLSTDHSTSIEEVGSHTRTHAFSTSFYIFLFP